MLRAIAAKSTSYVANRVDGFVLRAVDALGVDSNQLFHRLGLAYDGQRWTAPGETFDGNLVAVRYRLDQVFDGAGERLGVPRVPRSPLDTMNEAMHLPSTDGHSSSLFEQIRSIPDGEQRAKEWQAFADTRGVQASESMARALLPPNGPAHSYDPFRGNGFSGTGHGSFPEYDYGFDYGRGVPIFGAMPEGAEMWVLKPDGTEAVVARFDGVEWELP